MNKEEIFYRLLDDGSEGEVATRRDRIFRGATVMVDGRTADYVGNGLVVERAHVSISPPLLRVF